MLSAYQQLSDIEREFVDAYLTALQEAAKRANRRVVEFLDNREALALYYEDALIKRSLVQASISERVADLCRQTEIDAYSTLKSVSVISKATMANYVETVPSPFEGAGSRVVIRDLSTLTPEQMEAIESIETTTDRFGYQNVKIKLHSKLKALDMLMRYQGLYDLDNAQRAVTNGERRPAQLTIDSTVEDAGDAYARTLRNA